MNELVTIDIGGTHARFALAAVAADGAITLGEPVTLRTRDHASFQTAWEAFAAHAGRTLPPAVAIAIAGPVGGDVIRFTNNPWTIHPALIPQQLGASRYTLVNDFGAVGHAVARLPASDFAHLCGPDEPLPASGTLSVVGPGTGLGVAHVWRGGSGDYRVQATEGGHIDYAPLDGIEDAILARLRQRHRRVSAERVVSGPGIVDIYETLAAIENKPIRQLEPLSQLTALRRQKGFTQAGLAQKLGVEQPTVQRWEKGKRKPDLKQISALADALDVSISELVDPEPNYPIRMNQFDDKTLWQLGTSGEDSLAAAAVDRFCLALGAVAGDIALAQGASGVVIAGGLGLRIRDTLAASGFSARFRAKGRFEGLMASLPVKLITHPQPGLFGAAAAFAKEHLP